MSRSHSARREDARRASTGSRKPRPLFIWEQPWLRALFLVAFVFLAYTRVFHGGFIWDDDAHLTSPDLGSLGGLGRIWCEPGARQQYYPLTHTIFWVEHEIWGYAPLPYHLVNILLHAGSALLVWRILQKLEIPGAWLAAGIFALHPVEVESVAWISELKNTLSGVLFLGAALFYLRFDQERSRSTYFGALGLFGLGLLSKTAIAPLPIVLLAIFGWQRGKISWRRDVIPLLPFFAVAIPLGLFTAWVEQKFVGAKGEAFDFGFVERCLIAGRAFWFYLGKLFWPFDLIFIYPRWQISSSAWWQYLFPTAALLLFAILFALWKRWRGPLAGMLIFAVMLFPALGFFNVYPFIYSFVADHFQYLASVAVIALVAAGATLSAKNLPPGLRLLLSLALLACLAALTWHQSRNYTDRETLYRSILQKNPGSWMAHNNLAIVLEGKGQTSEAVTHYERAAEIYPRYVQARNNLAWVLATSPNASLRNGIRAVELAGQADRLSGGDKLVLRTLAAAYAETAQFGKAIENARAALQLARREGNTDLATELEQEIALYKRGLPYRETAE
jgi:protein O-mannosyl-transferase